MVEPMISYAQNCEDVVLHRVLQDVTAGFYVDVGASHPEHDSVTRHFSNLGWRGINIEPGRFHADLVRERPRDINLRVAASNHCGTATFYEGAAPGLAGLSPIVPDHLQWIVGERNETLVPIRTLASILDEHADGIVIDFLSIDVEGHEFEVLQGNDWRRHRPRVVLVEATEPGSRKPAYSHWEPILLAADYQFAYFDGLNRFYLRREDESLLPRFGPPCVFDRFITLELAQLRAGDPVISGAIKELTAERDYLSRQLGEVQSRLRHFENITAGVGHRSLKLSLWMARRLSSIKRRVA